MSTDGMKKPASWQENLQAAWAAEERRATQKKKRPLAAATLALTMGDMVFFVPPKATHDRYGQRAKVLRGPCADVASPSVRVEFPDGTEATVQARYLRRTPAEAVDPPFLVEARTLPSWKRLVKHFIDALPTPFDTKGEHQHFAFSKEVALAAEQRSRQLAGMVGRHLPKEERGQMAQVILEAAAAAAKSEKGKQAQRGGRGPVQHAALPAPSTVVDTRSLDQDQRAMINLIAKSIHRRYFLSDRQIERGQIAPADQVTVLRRVDASGAVREEVHALEPSDIPKIQRELRQIIGLGQREAGSTEAKNKRGGKGSELEGLMHDNLTAAYQKALEVCQWLDAGHLDHARTLAAQVQHHRAVVLAVDTELDKHRVKHHTGRYFHGDILSVRQEHIELDDDGNFQSYLGMTQFYVRVVIVYDEDGHTLIVANAPELESLTGLQVGPQGWASLCRWVQDMSERAGGRKQGRRQTDDERLIYQEHDGYLKLRPGLEKFSGLLEALTCIRAALLAAPKVKDVPQTDIPEGHPQEGFHPPRDRERCD